MLFYHLPTQVQAFPWPSDFASSQTSLRQRLDAWRDEISQIPAPHDHDSMERRKHEAKLHSLYYATMVLLYQPSQAIPRPDDASLLICYKCAASRLQIYSGLYNTDSLYQSWRTVHGIFSSGATMIYCLWTSAEVRGAVPSAAWEKALATCTNLLSVGGEWWPSVKRGRESFARALDALKVKFIAGHSGLDSRYGEPDKATRSRPITRPTKDNPTSARAFDAPLQYTSRLGEALSGPSNVAVTQADTQFLQSQDLMPQMPIPLDFGGAEWTDPDSVGAMAPFYQDFGPEAERDAPYYQQIDLTGCNAMRPLDDPDPTIEAFIATFMNGDTAWNPL